MKKTHIKIFTLCLFLLAFNYGCDKADIQKPTISSDIQITPRTTCNDCDDGDCCGAIMSLDNSMDLVLCGVYGTNLTTTTCSDNHFGEGDCPISGFELPVSLSGASDFEVFCVPINSSFSVYCGTGGTARVTCQFGQLTPVSIDLNFPGTNYIYVDEDCIVSGHCPF